MITKNGNIQDIKISKEEWVDSPFKGKVIDNKVEGQTGERHSLRKR